MSDKELLGEKRTDLLSLYLAPAIASIQERYERDLLALFEQFAAENKESHDSHVG